MPAHKAAQGIARLGAHEENAAFKAVRNKREKNQAPGREKEIN